MKTFAWLVRTVLFVLLLVFALQNQHLVEVHGLFGARWSAPLIWVLCGTLLLGAALGVLAMLPLLWRARARKKASTPTPPLTQPTIALITGTRTAHSDDELGI